MPDRLRITTLNGKYTVIQTEEGGMKFLRNGEPWKTANRDFAHVGLILNLAQEIESLRLGLKLMLEEYNSDGLERSEAITEANHLLNIKER